MRAPETDRQQDHERGLEDGGDGIGEADRFRPARIGGQADDRQPSPRMTGP